MVIICPTSEKSRRYKLVAYDVMSGVNLDQSEVNYVNLVNQRSYFAFEELFEFEERYRDTVHLHQY